MPETPAETIARIELALLDDVPVALSDVTAEIATAALGAALHPRLWHEQGCSPCTPPEGRPPDRPPFFAT